MNNIPGSPHPHLTAAAVTNVDPLASTMTISDKSVDTLRAFVKGQRQQIKHLKGQLRVYHQLDDDANAVPLPADHLTATSSPSVPS